MSGAAEGELRAVAVERHRYLMVLDGPRTGELHCLEEGETIIGRAEDAGLRLTEISVSRRHARLIVRDGVALVEDLGSMNGTLCNGERLVAPRPVYEGDLIAVGTVTMVHFSGDAEDHAVFRQRLRELGARDPLTGAWRVDHLWERLKTELAFACKRQKPLALLVVDVDYCSSVNGLLGRKVGDSLLREVADRLRGILQPEDFLARLRADKFAILSRGTDTVGAGVLGERLRVAVGACSFDCGGKDVPVTVSIGIGMAPASGVSCDQDLVEAALRAMRRAKAAGRNRVSLATPG